MIIEAARFYEEYELRQTGFLSESDLRKARAQGLRCRTIQRGRRVYKGAWLLRWLNAGDDGAGAGAKGGGK